MMGHDGTMEGFHSPLLARYREISRSFLLNPSQSMEPFEVFSLISDLEERSLLQYHREKPRQWINAQYLATWMSVNPSARHTMDPRILLGPAEAPRSPPLVEF